MLSCFLFFQANYNEYFDLLSYFSRWFYPLVNVRRNTTSRILLNRTNLQPETICILHTLSQGILFSWLLYPHFFRLTFLHICHALLWDSALFPFAGRTAVAIFSIESHPWSFRGPLILCTFTLLVFISILHTHANLKNKPVSKHFLRLHHQPHIRLVENVDERLPLQDHWSDGI